jgi:hypothetical protein
VERRDLAATVDPPRRAGQPFCALVPEARISRVLLVLLTLRKPGRLRPVQRADLRRFGFLDAVGFAVNKENPLDKLSFDQLDRILSSPRRGGVPPPRLCSPVGR